MFWDCFGWYGIGPLVVVMKEYMNLNNYINILANYFISYVSNYPDSIFQQDKASYHTSSYNFL